MQDFPSVPTDADSSVVTSGHCWILEYVAGEPLRFQLQPSGLIRFGDDERTYSDPDDLPRRYAHAVSHVQQCLGRDGLRSALPDLTAVTFFGIATQRQGIAYDWQELPSFLGVDVWSSSQASFVPPDVAHQVFVGIGLVPLPPIEQEVHARDITVEEVEVPHSKWADGPAAGVLIRNKRGGRALIRSSRSEQSSGELPVSVDELVEEVTTLPWIDTVVGIVQEREQAVTIDAVIEELMRTVWRVYHPTFTGGRGTIDPEEVRSGIARYVSQQDAVFREE